MELPAAKRRAEESPRAMSWAEEVFPEDTPKPTRPAAGPPPRTRTKRSSGPFRASGKRPRGRRQGWLLLWHGQRHRQHRYRLRYSHRHPLPRLPAHPRDMGSARCTRTGKKSAKTLRGGKSSSPSATGTANCTTPNRRERPKQCRPLLRNGSCRKNKRGVKGRRWSWPRPGPLCCGQPERQKQQRWIQAAYIATKQGQCWSFPGR